MGRERRRQGGILNGLGCSGLEMDAMLLGETFVLTLFGSAAGILLTFITQAILKETNPALTILISSRWVLQAIALALVGAAAGAVYPALRAAGYDPVVALAYE